jgi:hypothetical protein
LLAQLHRIRAVEQLEQFEQQYKLGVGVECIVKFVVNIVGVNIFVVVVVELFVVIVVELFVVIEVGIVRLFGVGIVGVGIFGQLGLRLQPKHGTNRR